MSAGLINTAKPNTSAINGTDYHALVDLAQIAVNVNQMVVALLNAKPLNSVAINGTEAEGDIAVQQVHIVTIDNADISIDVWALAHVYAPLNNSPVNALPVNGDIIPAGAIIPENVYLASVNNAAVVVACPKVMVAKGQGGYLFVTVDDGTTHRFSFEGVKA